MRRNAPPTPTPGVPSRGAAFGAAALALVLGIAWMLAGVGRFGRVGFAMDDPYIHLEFARNLAAGAGFSFNPHEPVPGATSPLWVLALTPVQLLGIPAEPAAALLGILSAALAAFLAFDLAVACALPAGLAAIAALATAAAARFTWASLSGMETCLAAALSLALVRAHISALSGARRGLVLGLLAGLAAAARPELALLGALIGVMEIFRDPARAGGATSPAAARSGLRDRLPAVLAYGATFAAMLLPYVIFCMATTGRPLPNTFYAKSVLPASQTDYDLGALRASYLPTMLRWAIEDNPLLGLLLVPGLLLWWFRRAPAGSRAVALWPLLFWAYSLALFPRHFSLSRYTIPLMPFLAILGAGALDWLRMRLPAPNTRRVAVVAAAVLCLAGAARGQFALGPVYLAQVENILRMHVAVAEWVARNTPADARIATHDVGAIGYYGGRACTDIIGLVDSRFIDHQLEWRRRHDRVDVEESLADYLAADPPDYCILFPQWYPRTARAPWLEPVHGVRFRNVTGGGDELIVFRRTGPPSPPPAAAGGPGAP